MDNPHPSDTPIRSEEDQAAFFQQTLDCCRKAEAAVGVEIHTLELAGTRIDLHFAGPRLVPHFLPALSHLLVKPEDDPALTPGGTPGAEPDLVLHLWDSESTGVENHPPPCKWDCFTDRGDIWGMSSPRYKSAFHWIEFALNMDPLAISNESLKDIHHVDI